MTINRININTLNKYIDDEQTILVPNLRTKDAILFQYLEEQKGTIAPAPKILRRTATAVRIMQMTHASGTHRSVKRDSFAPIFLKLDSICDFDPYLKLRYIFLVF